MPPEFIGGGVLYSIGVNDVVDYGGDYEKDYTGRPTVYVSLVDLCRKFSESGLNSASYYVLRGGVVKFERPEFTNEELQLVAIISPNSLIKFERRTILGNTYPNIFVSFESENRGFVNLRISEKKAGETYEVSDFTWGINNLQLGRPENINPAALYPSKTSGPPEEYDKLVKIPMSVSLIGKELLASYNNDDQYVAVKYPDEAKNPDGEAVVVVSTAGKPNRELAYKDYVDSKLQWGSIPDSQEYPLDFSIALDNNSDDNVQVSLIFSQGVFPGNDNHTIVMQKGEVYKFAPDLAWIETNTNCTFTSTDNCLRGSNSTFMFNNINYQTNKIYYLNAQKTS